MIERLAQFIDYLDVSVRSFEKKIAASDGMIRRAINNNTDIQSKWMQNIADNYPELNIEWLLTGKGSMLKSEQTEIYPKSQEDKDTDKIKIIVLEKMLVEKDKRIENLNREVGKLLQMLEGFRDLQLKRCSKDTNASDANAG